MKALAVGCVLAFGTSSSALALNFNRTVPSGQTAVMHAYKSWDRNCASNSGVVRVITKPLHGKLSTRVVNAEIRSSRFSSRGRSRCQGTPIKAFQVEYRSVRGFRGVDTFTLEPTFGNGRQDTDIFTVTVE
jgi:hypothetical protein